MKTYPAENSGRPARHRWTACCTWYSQMSLMRLSNQLPHGLPSRFTAPHIPRSRAVPMMATEAALSGVSASMLGAPGFCVTSQREMTEYDISSGQRRKSLEGASKNDSYLERLKHPRIKQSNHRSLAQFSHRLEGAATTAFIY